MLSFMRIGLWMIILSCVASSVSRAGWIENGVPLTLQWSAQEGAVIASDGASGAIIAFPACHGGSCIVAQRVNSDGSLQWGQDGVVICSGTGDRGSAAIVPDGAGGAIVTWMDSRSGSYDIYAQRLNSSGEAQWAPDGVAVCMATGDQRSPEIITDGGAGAIVTWWDYRSGNYDIFAQRVNGSGEMQWSANGVVLCAAIGSQWTPVIVTDGTGGAIVTWIDYRSGEGDIYAQRMNASGVVQWAADGVALCTATRGQSVPAIVSDGSGGAIVTWWDYRSGNGDLYAQRVNASGEVQWTADGEALCVATGEQESPAIVSDGGGGAIATWADSRSGNRDIYAQRLNASGAAQWAANGVALCTATMDQVKPAIVSDGNGGAIAAWLDSRNGDAIYAQSVSASGAAQWVPDGVALGAAAGAEQPFEIVSDGGGGAIVTRTDYRGGSYDIYAQRVNASGEMQWAVDVAISIWTGDQQSPAIVSDGVGGAIMTWTNYRGGSYDIHAQRVSAAGGVQWAATGVAVRAAASYQSSAAIVSDGSGGAIGTWTEYRSLSWNVYAQRVSASGEVQWTADGMAVCAAPGTQRNPAMVSDGGGGTLVTWQDYRSESYKIYAQRVNASGEAQWAVDGIALCAATGEQLYPQIISDGGGGAIVTWMDHRNGNGDIYAQRVDASGAVQWAATGVAVYAAAGDQRFPAIVSDGSGGAIVTWSNARSGNWDKGDVYAQRVNGSGEVQWAVGGVALAATGTQGYPAIVSDEGGGAIVAWIDGRSGDYAIYAQRVNVSGVVEWAADGVAVCGTWAEWDFAIVSDGEGGVIVTWADDRSGNSDNWDIYAQKVNASGAAQWAADGVALCTATGSQGSPAIVSDGDGGAIVTWQDARCGRLVYANRVDAAGHVGPDAITTLPQNYSAAYALTLYQNRPNPFNPSTVIRFYLPEAEAVVLDIYDVAGRRVARLVAGREEKGYHEVSWDGRNGAGAQCSSGVYFSRLTAGKRCVTGKMVMMR